LKLVEPQVPPARGALDDYFDRLDAALERLDDQVARADAPADQDDPGLPTIDKLLGEERSAPRGAVLIDHPLRGAYAASDNPESSRSTGNGAEPVLPADAAHATSVPTSSASSQSADLAADAADAAPRGRDLSSLVEALEALRRRGPADAPLPAFPFNDASSSPTAPVEVTEAMVEEVTRRVLERLAPGAIDRVVTDIVTQVAEKLLREEIARLK